MTGSRNESQMPASRSPAPNRPARVGARWAIIALIAGSLAGCPSGQDEERDPDAARIAPTRSTAEEANPAATHRATPLPSAREPGEANASEPPSTGDGPPADELLGVVLDAEPEGTGLDTLIRAASSESDGVVREAAVVALGDSQDPRALDALIAATEDPDPRVAIAAIEQLRWFDDRLAENAIRRQQDARDPELARAARAALPE